ncbi:oligopeptide ABC transporter permease [Caldisalinibacter kiritimatiensis]|uniref:Oligopeptide transport system permease protein OppC n=1 Tax=Caldisalinibacter kiritimatiensis TaxID=1304284 RepID=R1CDQ3_9FIRM|nr:oligopeptide ABC transporter permease [Caldisalinibacter kiritimatiensis]EOD00415.1 Oligopeptide transport system permease protein OppC [Caldisalinibacter kiritimatiensis]
MTDEKKQDLIKNEKNDEIISPWTLALRRLKKNKLAIMSLIILSILILLAVFAPFVTPYGVNELNLESTKQPPSSKHLLGTDDVGRDVLTRLIYGGRISLSVGIVAVILEVLIGTILGGIAGYYGGKIDSIIMRLADIVMCFPFLLIAITVVSIIGPSIYNVMLVIGFLGWTGIARIVRGQILSLKEQEFMEAAEALGLSDRRKIFRHLLPNTLASVVVFATLGIAGAILTEAALSYLGMGVNPPTPSWGNMLESAKNLYVIKKQWWLWIPPGLAIFITVMSLNILGDGLRDAFDPKLKD